LTRAETKEQSNSSEAHIQECLRCEIGTRDTGRTQTLAAAWPTTSSTVPNLCRKIGFLPARHIPRSRSRLTRISAYAESFMVALVNGK